MAGSETHTRIDLTNHTAGYIAITLFVLAYALMMTEEFTHLRKSKPVILAAGLIWGILGYINISHGMPELAEEAIRRNLLEYSELMSFLLVTMTYINAM